MRPRSITPCWSEQFDEMSLHQVWIRSPNRSRANWRINASLQAGVRGKALSVWVLAPPLTSPLGSA
jgi:hypothetical protein